MAKRPNVIYVGKEAAKKADQLAVIMTKEFNTPISIRQATRIAIDEALSRRAANPHT